MIIFFIGFITLTFLLNSWYYNYRMPKKTDDMRAFNNWIDLKLRKRYNK